MPVRTIDLLERRDLVLGAVDVQAFDSAVRFPRMPRTLFDHFDAAEGSRVRAHCTAGVRIAFRSAARSIRVGVRYLDAVPWTKRYALDLTVDGTLTATFGAESGTNGARWEGVIFEADAPRARDFVLWLPHLAEVLVERLEVDADAPPTPLPGPEARWLFIGDSITQGFVTDHPSIHVAPLAAAALGMDHHNMALGGGTVEPILVEAARAVPAELITVALGVNDYSRARTADEFGQAAQALLNGLRAAAPRARIVYVTPIPYHTFTGKKNDAGLIVADYGEIVRRQAEGVERIEVIDGYALVPDEAQWFVDNCHPNEAGHRHYARGLAAALGRRA